MSAIIVIRGGTGVEGTNVRSHVVSQHTTSVRSPRRLNGRCIETGLHLRAPARPSAKREIYTMRAVVQLDGGLLARAVMRDHAGVNGGDLYDELLDRRVLLFFVGLV